MKTTPSGCHSSIHEFDKLIMRSVDDQERSYDLHKSKLSQVTS